MSDYRPVVQEKSVAPNYKPIFYPECGTRQPPTNKFCVECVEPLQTTGRREDYEYNRESRRREIPQPVVVNVVNNNTNNNTNNNGMGSFYIYKSRWAAFFLCLFFGLLGIHRFYVGKGGTGFLWLITGGLFGIGCVIDLLLLLFGGFRDKNGYPLRLFMIKNNCCHNGVGSSCFYK